MGKGDRSTRREKRKGEGRVMRKSFSRLVQLAGVGWRARCSESCTAGSGKGGGKRVREENALAAYFTLLSERSRPWMGCVNFSSLFPVVTIPPAGATFPNGQSPGIF